MALRDALGAFGARLGNFTASALSQLTAFAVGQAASAVISPELQNDVNAAWRRNQDVPLSPAEAAAAAVQNVWDGAQAAEEAKSSGLHPDRFEALVRIHGNPPGPGELFDLWNRGTITEGDVDKGLRQSALKNEWIASLKELARVKPSVSDIIRFAVREAYSEAQVSRFDLAGGIPGEFLDEARKRGLHEEDARRYWIAHWDLPSATQGFEMLHRGEITEDELDSLLKAADVAPFWRDRLSAIAYRVPTRVDTRRMYEDGVLAREEVFRLYLDAGYDAENAERLTQWTVTRKLKAERDLTKTEVVGLVESGRLAQAEAETMLNGLGYDADEVGFIFALADYRRAKRLTDQGITTIRSKYVAWRITETEAVSALDELTVPAEERRGLLEFWAVEREANAPDVPVTTLARFLKKDIIDRAEFDRQMARKGYTNEESGWFTKDALG